MDGKQGGDSAKHARAIVHFALLQPPPTRSAAGLMPSKSLRREELGVSCTWRYADLRSEASPRTFFECFVLRLHVLMAAPKRRRERTLVVLPNSNYTPPFMPPHAPGT